MPGGIIVENNPLRAGRFTSGEFEKWQGFPVGYTELGNTLHRYHLLGNSMIVPVIKWIGREFTARCDKQ
ncbi:DNA cytosine methyltransferase [Erwinia psidii]|uniref:DNA cytosine methyltransferase n=1 Tax=Erwinia psidii TaxID=69224 RepID=A0A3N6V3R5_9GAMM|nr:DNA cytosine methyltransferase [Erwinia psidii]MCX8956409.1 DNA cytosine methyltransferase [Erwinia psidii]MCX8962255.1 DNA cytosine methyltransferase [Erwinia psidii]MCX8965800.1 DNA cytosine methyltransferase [Erwinia psidii]RQM39745.1 DNA cytosine methyltransferase [Erwinia psidii]